MAAATTIVVNGRRVPARHGQTLLDAALAARIAIPHDCASGQCSTCRVRIYDGTVEAGGTEVNGTVLACRATVTGEAVIEFDEVPAVRKLAGRVRSVEDLTPDVVEVTIGLDRRPAYLPGQYVKVAFRGFPARDYSPTLRRDGSADLDEIVLHIRREPGGAVSTALGAAIAPGHAVAVRGPFGSAFHRLGQGRLVLVSTGVGFAPVWSIARASRLREPERPLLVVAGARHPQNLYMTPCLDWLAERGAGIVVTCSGIEADRPGLRKGRPTLHLPRLTPQDTVVACGAPGMVAAVELLAAAGGATCYADPFVPAQTPRRLRDRLLRPFLGRAALGLAPQP